MKPRKKTAKQTARDKARMDHFIQNKKLSGEFPFASVNHVDFDSVVNKEWPIRQELKNLKAQLQASCSIQKGLKTLNQELLVRLKTKQSELDIFRIALEKQVPQLINSKEFQCKIQQMERLTSENEKLASDNVRVGEDIMKLQENLVKHVKTIKHLERKISPEVNNLQTTNRGSGRGNPHQKKSRRGTRCPEIDCKKYIERCEFCGRSMDTDFCDSCKVTTSACTTCSYGNLNDF